MSRSARAVVSRTFVSAVSPSFAGGGTATSSSSFPRPRCLLLLLLLLLPPPSRPFPQSSPVPGKWRIFAPSSLSKVFPLFDDDDVTMMTVGFSRCSKTPSSSKTSSSSSSKSSSSRTSRRERERVLLLLLLLRGRGGVCVSSARAFKCVT